ncbi:MAG TPA: hypothetical protein PKD90_11475 [Phnomibacter sp.]|nr:hypothetical protein [Phnomibacter sp.]
MKSRKKNILLLSIIVLSANAVFSQNSIGIGIATPHLSALLDVNSNSKGILIPRMTSAQRGAIASPGVGLMVFDTDTKTFWYHNGVTWVNLTAGGGGGGLTLPFEAAENQANEVFKIINSGMGASLSGVSQHEFGRGLVGVATGAFGQAIYGSAALPDAIAVFGEGTGATGVRGYSATGFGMEARSTSNSAIRASII